MHIAAAVFAGARALALARGLRSLNSQFNISRKWETTVTLRSPPPSLLPVSFSSYSSSAVFFRRFSLFFSFSLREKQTDVPGRRLLALKLLFSRLPLSVDNVDREVSHSDELLRTRLISFGMSMGISTLRATCIYVKLLHQNCHYRLILSSYALHSDSKFSSRNRIY